MSEDLTFVPCGQKSEKIAKNGVFSEIGSTPPPKQKASCQKVNGKQLAEKKNPPLRNFSVTQVFEPSPYTALENCGSQGYKRLSITLYYTKHQNFYYTLIKLFLMIQNGFIS